LLLIFYTTYLLNDSINLSSLNSPEVIFYDDKFISIHGLNIYYVILFIKLNNLFYNFIYYSYFYLLFETESFSVDIEFI
jgi:hypothetical protein